MLLLEKETRQILAFLYNQIIYNKQKLILIKTSENNNKTIIFLDNDINLDKIKMFLRSKCIKKKKKKRLQV